MAEIDRRLVARLSREQVETMRAALIALAEIKAADAHSVQDTRRSARNLRRFSPIFRVRDLRAAIDHYGTLGFDTQAYEDGDDYGFARRDGVELHLAAHTPEMTGPGSAYLYVRDADALYARWSRPGIAGHTHPVAPTPYKLREGSHVDPDGNLIRFGSFVDEDAPTDAG